MPLLATLDGGGAPLNSCSMKHRELQVWDGISRTERVLTSTLSGTLLDSSNIERAQAKWVKVCSLSFSLIILLQLLLQENQSKNDMTSDLPPF